MAMRPELKALGTACPAPPFNLRKKKNSVPFPNNLPRRCFSCVFKGAFDSKRAKVCRIVRNLENDDDCDRLGYELLPTRMHDLQMRTQYELLGVCREKASPCSPCLRGASFLSNFNTETRRSRSLHGEIQFFRQTLAITNIEFD